MMPQKGVGVDQYPGRSRVTSNFKRGI